MIYKDGWETFQYLDRRRTVTHHISLSISANLKKRITAKFADVNQSIKKITKGGKICWLDKAEKILPDSPEHDDDYMIYVIHYIV